MPFAAVLCGHPGTQSLSATASCVQILMWPFRDSLLSPEGRFPLKACANLSLVRELTDLPTWARMGLLASHPVPKHGQNSPARSAANRSGPFRFFGIIVPLGACHASTVSEGVRRSLLILIGRPTILAGETFVGQPLPCDPGKRRSEAVAIAHLLAVVVAKGLLIDTLSVWRPGTSGLAFQNAWQFVRGSAWAS
jgi:hypothetical protein